MERNLSEVSTDSSKAEVVQWVDKDALKDWQRDKLSRYVPSATSEEDYDMKMMEFRRKKKFKVKLRRHSTPKKKIAEDVDEMIAAYPDVWSAFVMLKLSNLERPKQTFKARKCWSREPFWTNDHRGPPRFFADNTGPVLEGESDVELAPLERVEEDKATVVEPEAANKKTKKELEKERARLEKEKEKERLELQSESEDSDSSDSQYERKFISKEYQKIIDNVQSRNFIRQRTKEKFEQSCAYPQSLYVKSDIPCLTIAPSLRNISDYKLGLSGRTFFLHRVIYVVAFKVNRRLMGVLGKKIAFTFRNYVQNHNASYAANHRLCGCLLYYQEGVAIAMVEGGEYEVSRHFFDLENHALMKEFCEGKILSVETYVEEPFLKSFIICTATPPASLVMEKIKADTILSEVYQKMSKTYTHLLNSSVDPSKLYELTAGFTSHLPTLRELIFILKYPPLRNLFDFIKSYSDVPYASDSSDEIWPVPKYAIPFNIWNPTKDELGDLEKEMVEEKARCQKLRKVMMNQGKGPMKSIDQRDITPETIDDYDFNFDYLDHEKPHLSYDENDQSLDLTDAELSKSTLATEDGTDEVW